MYRAVLYISDATLSDEAPAKQLQKINEISCEANKQHDISGVLAFSKNRFLHVLEGEQSVLSSLLENIEKDPRNENLAIILDTSVHEKIYDDWEMIDSRSEKQSELLGYFLRRSIDDLPLVSQSQHKILEEFVNDIFN